MIKQTKKRSVTDFGLPNFVKKLSFILNDETNKKSIRWTNQGTGFQIADEQNFTNNVLSKFYRHSNMSSFIRQLNMYGFRKIKEDDRQFYMHPYFLKSQPQLSQRITRKPQKKLSAHAINENKENKIQELSENYQEEIDYSKRKVRRVCFMSEDKVAITQQGVLSIKALQHDVCSRQSLANLIGKSQATIFNNHQIQDGISICEHLSEESEQEESKTVQHKSKALFWTPSAILSENNGLKLSSQFKI